MWLGLCFISEGAIPFAAKDPLRVIPVSMVGGAVTGALSVEWGRPTAALCALYERWSEGGTGLLITGNVQVDRRYLERPGNVCIDGPQDSEARTLLTQLATAGLAVAEGRLGPPRRWAAERSAGDAVRGSERERLG